jgi:hypothetical protein
MTDDKTMRAPQAAKRIGLAEDYDDRQCKAQIGRVHDELQPTRATVG